MTLLHRAKVLLVHSMASSIDASLLLGPARHACSVTSILKLVSQVCVCVCCCRQGAANDKILVDNVAPAWAALLEALCSGHLVNSPAHIYRYFH